MRMRIIVIIAGLLAAIGLGALILLKYLHPLKAQNQSGVSSGLLESEQSLLQGVQNLERKGDALGLKVLYQKLVSDFPNNKDAGLWQKKIEELNIKIIFSSLIVPGLSREYIIQPQDNLTKIAKQFNTTIELIKKSNNLSSDNIRPGRKLRVWTARFGLLVDKSQNTLMLKCNDEIFKTYNVATGTNNSTPLGTVKVGNKLINPVWYKEGAVVPPGAPENILGTRWMGFEELPGYGIHGTTDPESIGRQATAGCVRMINTEVEELYALLPIGTEVTIVD